MKRISRFLSLKPGRRSDSGFAGYTWQVVTITRDSKETPIPARYNVYLKFTRRGEFTANDPVNIHHGTYRVTSDGFATSDLMSTFAGYAGEVPAIVMSMDAITAFNFTASATATVTGDRLEVTVGEYQLGCQRDGAA
jgi:META domain